MSKAWITRLFATAVLLPAATVVLGAFGRLLRVMGDQSAAGVLDRLALTGGILWVFALLGLLLALAARHASDAPEE